MADQNFLDLASKTASGIAGTDYMMLVNNSEAYKALVNDVAEAILSKLTSKSFSGLETTAKNVIGALNELNSNIKNKAESVNSYVDAGGQSILDIIRPTETPNGIYTYTNIDDIPESSNPKNNFIRVIKMREAMIVLNGGHTFYMIVASSGQWLKTWYKFSGTTVS